MFFTFQYNGLSLFNIYLCDNVLAENESDITIYVGDNSPYT